MPPQRYQYADYEDSPESGESFDYLRFYYALKERIWVVALCLVAAGFLTVGYLKRSPEIYAATVVLQAELNKPKLLNIEDPVAENLGPDALKTITKLMTSRSVMRRVIATNNLATDPRFVGEGGASVGTPNLDKLIRRLQGMVSVEPQYGTLLLNLTVEHTDRELARELADAVVEQFMTEVNEQRIAAAEAAMRMLQREEERFRAKVDESERALHAYRESRGAVSLEGGQDIVVQKLKDINQKLTDAAAVRLGLESEYLQCQEVGVEVERLLSLRTIANDPAVANALIQVSQQEVEIGNLTKRYLPKHPKYIMAVNKLLEWQVALSNATMKARETLSNSFHTAKATEEAFKKELKEQESLVFRLSQEGIEYKNLDREAKANRDLYESVLTRMKETAISKDWEPNKVSVVQAAYAPAGPVKPDKQRILMMGLLVGIGVGVALALGLELLDSSLKTPDQTESLLGVPILTAVPRLRSVQAGRKQIVMTSEGDSYGAEAFRTLRTTLAMLGAEGARRTFLFTSSVPEEGKTFCALNYAYSLAQQGLRTLVVEADLRCPAVERGLPFELNSAPGLADYLSNQMSLEAIVQSSDHPNLAVVLAGTRVPNPSELLAQDTFGALLQEALLQFDRVVIDSAPIHPVSDTLLLVGQVQTVCLVVCADRAPRKAALRAVQMLQKAGAPLAGVIFNRLSQARGHHYYDYSYYPEYVERAAENV